MCSFTEVSGTKNEPLVLVNVPGVQLLDVCGPLDVFAEANLQAGSEACLDPLEEAVLLRMHMFLLAVLPDLGSLGRVESRKYAERPSGRPSRDIASSSAHSRSCPKA